MEGAATAGFIPRANWPIKEYDIIMTDEHRKTQIALLGSYVPRQCGIATFTKDLHDSVANHTAADTLVLAMDDYPEGYDYPREVRFQLLADDLHDYRMAADLLNINQVDLVLLQHEFGIFGGRTGENILAFLRNLRMPVMTTLHTVLNEPTREQAAVMRELGNLSDRLVVMCDTAVNILEETYDIPSDNIAMIGHGIPDLPFSDSAFFKDQFGLEGRPTMLTFGLLSPGKGLEVVIDALPKIVERYPNVAYVILGAIHPHVFQKDGNAYLIKLKRQAEKLGVSDNVIFHTRYVSIDELCGYLGASDVFVTPYPNKSQIVSGTLAYAMGAGKAVVSTPYWYAEEMLAEERGRLFPFGDSEALANHVMELLDNPVDMAAMRKRAYMYTRSMVWSEVGKRYYALGQEVLQERTEKPRPVFHLRMDLPEKMSLPEVRTNHLRAMTDDTGMFQHAVYSIPDRHHGYCSDDNARALIAAIMCRDIIGDKSVMPLAQTYLSFLHHAFDPEARRFRNFMGYDRRWLETVGSEDVHGRCIWGLGVAAALAKEDAIIALSSRLFCDAIGSMAEMRSPRAWAFALVGIHAYLKRFSGDSLVRRTREQLARRLHQNFKDNATEEWPWCEDILTYDNARLPHALILSGQWLPDAEMHSQGLRSLEWVVQQQLTEDGRVTIIGNDGWMTRDGYRARFDQQPVDVMALVEACSEAYRSTREDKWHHWARRFFDWFLGNNDLESIIYDASTGGCRDGLHMDGPNLNQGAESTLAWLIALLAMHQAQREFATGLADDTPEKEPIDTEAETARSTARPGE